MNSFLVYLVLGIGVIAVTFWIFQSYPFSGSDLPSPSPSSIFSPEASLFISPSLPIDSSPAFSPTASFFSIAVLRARDMLALELSVRSEDVNVVSVSSRTWPDACLGLPYEGEVCVTVLTPGYEITFSFQGRMYLYRTNETGDIIRKVS